MVDHGGVSVRVVAASFVDTLAVAFEAIGTVAGAAFVAVLVAALWLVIFNNLFNQ